MLVRELITHLLQFEPVLEIFMGLGSDYRLLEKMPKKQIYVEVMNDIQCFESEDDLSEYLYEKSLDEIDCRNKGEVLVFKFPS